MKPIYIDNNSCLLEAIDDLKTSSILFIDTEFHRENTYRPVLCLLQIYADGEKVYLVDPLSTDFDISPILEFLKESKSVKVFHSAFQDIETFIHRLGFIPKPLIDTQILAAYLGYGEQVSFDKMTQSILNKKMDKSQQRTDWRKRPLSDKQINYAASDVYYLSPLYKNLWEKILDKNRVSWIKEDIEFLENEKSYHIQKDKIIKKVKHKFTDESDISIIKNLAIWREKIAEKKDILRSKVIDDKFLILLTKKKPSNMDDLKNLRLPLRVSDNYGSELCDIINNPSTLPPSLDINLSSKNKNLFDLLMLFTKQMAEDLELTPQILASSNDLKKYISKGDAKFLSGWRYDIFGKYIVQIHKGKKSIIYKNNKIILV